MIFFDFLSVIFQSVLRGLRVKRKQNALENFEDPFRPLGDDDPSRGLDQA